MEVPKLEQDVVHPKPTFGSPTAKTLTPFSSNDLMQSFFHGVVWGSVAILLLSVAAWLVSVMRHRVFFNTTSSTLPRQRNLPDHSINTVPPDPYDSFGDA
jgi:heme exporter protein D